ncbi:MAG: hypothetical protein ACLT8C_00675 [Akkermansia muciniphila]
MEEGLVPTDFGGDVECVEVSALTGAGVDDLLAFSSSSQKCWNSPTPRPTAALHHRGLRNRHGQLRHGHRESGTIRVGIPSSAARAGKVRALVSDHGERVAKR